MSDDIDRANDEAAQALTLALQQHQAAQLLPPQRVVAGEVMCRDCENEIPAPRLAALPGCVRCIECQLVYERG